MMIFPVSQLVHLYRMRLFITRDDLVCIPRGELRQSFFCMFPSSTRASGVCVATEFLGWNRDPQGKTIWRWAWRESWGQRAELSWRLCCLKGEKLLFSGPLRREVKARLFGLWGSGRLLYFLRQVSDSSD